MFILKLRFPCRCGRHRRQSSLNRVSSYEERQAEHDKEQVAWEWDNCIIIIIFGNSYSIGTITS